MRVSIIIPCYNSEKKIAAAIESVLTQTFSDWELLIIDGKSSDKTIDVVKQYEDFRIKIYSEPDKGVYDAMNKGIAYSSGEWLYFMGSDDRLLDSQVLSDVFENDNSLYDVVYGDVESTHLPVINRGPWEIDKLEHNRCHQAIFYRRKALLSVGGYNLKYPIHADHDVNVRLYLIDSKKFKYIKRNIAVFSSGGLSSETDEVFYADFHKRILRKIWNKVGFQTKKHYIYQILLHSKFCRHFQF